MKCERVAELLSARLDGELTAQETEELEDHLARCPACRALEAQLAALHDSLQDMDELQAPEGFAQGVMEQVRAGGGERAKVVPLLRRPRFKALAGLAACAVLCVGLYRTGWLDGSAEQGAADLALRSAEGSEAAGADGSVARASLDESHAICAEGALEADNGPALYSLEPECYTVQNDQYIRVCYGSTPEAPFARILGSEDSLAEFLARFPEDDLSAVTAAYGAEFFQTGRLLAVVVEEGSGSVRHAVTALEWDQVTVQRQVPEAGDQDMAAWLILAEVGAMFEDGQTLNVVLSE